jgi:hypothetical protein
MTAGDCLARFAAFADAESLSNAEPQADGTIAVHRSNPSFSPSH